VRGVEHEHDQGDEDQPDGNDEAVLAVVQHACRFAGDRERGERPPGRTPWRAELIGVEPELLTDEGVERGFRVPFVPVFPIIGTGLMTIGMLAIMVGAIGGLSQRHRYVLVKKRRIVSGRGDVSAADDR